MKKIIFLAITLYMCTGVSAQARLVTASYQKDKHDAVEADIPFPEKMVNDAIEQQLQKMGYRGKDNKGYVYYQGVRMPQIGPDSYDLYFKTAHKSKNKKDATLVTLLISSGYDKFIDNTSNPELITNVKSYLDNITATVAGYDLEQQIAAQEAMVKKFTKKLADITSDGDALQKKKAKLDNDIADNLKLQETQKAATDTEQQILQTLVDKRKQ